MCALITLACFLAAQPYVSIGMSDDFSYVKTAWVFAQTGHFVYNGWATAMLGWQILWAAPFIKLLGPTWFACRLSVTVLLVLVVPLAHAVMVRAGLNRVHALFGTLLVGLCPLTLSLSATFMTDTGGLLVILLALYCAMRAVSAGTDRAVLGWLALGFAVGALGGSSRQISWLASLVLMPSAAWLLRKRRGVIALSAVLWLAGFAFVLWCLWWFKHQPYNVPEPLVQGKFNWGSLHSLICQFAEGILCLILLITPVLGEAFPRAVRLAWWKLVGPIAAAAVVTLALQHELRHDLTNGFMPWTGDWLARMDLFRVWNMWSYGNWPATFSVAGRGVLSVIILSIAAIFAWVLFTTRREEHSVSAAAALTGAPVLSWRELAVLLVPFTICYFILLMPRELWSLLLDRYLLPLMVIAALALLRVCQERLSTRLSAASWVLLAIWTFWAVAGVHDWFAGFRARTVAVARLEAAGIPSAKIRAGFELDGLTQINETGAVVDPRVKFPAGFDTRPHRPSGLPADCEYLYHKYTPTLEPEYWLTYDPMRCLAPSSFGEVDYRAWLPPFHRRQLILKLNYNAPGPSQQP
jgi:hypothetical protein